MRGRGVGLVAVVFASLLKPFRLVVPASVCRCAPTGEKR